MAPPQGLRIFTRETLVKGQPTQVECAEIDGRVYSMARGPITVVSLEEEWFDDVRNPDAVISALSSPPGFRPDLFTFWQRLPDVEPKHKHYLEWESIAALPIQSFDHWFNKQIKAATRNMIRKSQKAGVEVREDHYDDSFVQGMVALFNESPVRQGRPFWHYGKDFKTIRAQFSRYLSREVLIGAYFGGEMIGLVMLGNARKYGVLGQFISMIKHRDKAVNNVLISKTVEVCGKLGLPYLVYGSWATSSLSDFKRHSGFEEVRLPRYFVPLTRKGDLALKCGLHRRWKEIIPARIQTPLKKLRKLWYDLYAC